jgi:twinkle protein
MVRTVNSAYRANADNFNTAEFTNDRLVDRESRSEVDDKAIDPAIYDVDIKPKDVVFGEDVKGSALDILREGYEQVDGIGVDEFDYHFKFKRGEGTLLTGIGNYGKSSLWKWLLMMRSLKFGDKWAMYSPEDNPAQEFYHDLVEIYLGAQCTPDNPNKPSESDYNMAYDYVSEHFFYVYPESATPTPEYIKERFLELIIKENVDGVVIDPLNLLTHNYGAYGGREDKYLEWLLTDLNRFAQINNVYYTLVAHPRMMRKAEDGNYPCPDVFDLSGGAMFNNKFDNILVYHRPYAQTNPQSSECEFHSKKIRRQKIVGKKGMISFMFNFPRRRYIFNGRDYMEELITGKIGRPAPIVPDGYYTNHTIEQARPDEFEQQEIDLDSPDF